TRTSRPPAALLRRAAGLHRARGRARICNGAGFRAPPRSRLPAFPSSSMPRRAVRSPVCSGLLDPIELVPVGALHENRDRLGDRAVAVENVIHVLRDRRLDAELLRERVAGGRGVEALGHGALAREVNARVGAPRDLLPERPIARLVTRAREDEI